MLYSTLSPCCCLLRTIQGVEFWALNTDAQALAAHPAPNKIQIGTEITRGLGCGGNPAIGLQSAKESEEALRRMLQVSRGQAIVHGALLACMLLEFECALVPQV